MTLHSPLHQQQCRGTDVNDQDDRGQTALHGAVTMNLQPLVEELLLLSGIDVNRRDMYGRTPLNIAAANKNLEITSMLLKSGAIVDCEDIYGLTPLHIAAENNSALIARKLLECGAIVNSQGNGGETPLHFAASNNDAELVIVLLESGADVNCFDCRRQTPLHMAADRGHPVISVLLITAGAHVNCIDSDGRSPLHLAVQSCWWYTASVETLLEAGASPEVKDADGRTPLHFANTDVAAECLISKGARVDEKDYFGITPLDRFLERRLMTKLRIKLSVVNVRNSLCDIDLDDVKIKKTLGDRLIECKRFKRECTTEVQKMKKQKVGTLSLFNVIRDSQDPGFASRAYDIENMLDVAEKQNEYPIYMSLLRDRFVEGVRRKALLDEATDTLPSLNPTLGIPELRRMILAQLTDRDLENVIKAFVSTNNSY